MGLSPSERALKMGPRERLAIVLDYTKRLEERLADARAEITLLKAALGLVEERCISQR